MDHDEDDYTSDTYDYLRPFAWGLALVCLVAVMLLGWMSVSGML